MKYKVGDKVRVRQWDDMVEKYGMIEYCINTPNYLFVPEMRKHCGKIVIIEKVNELMETYYIGGDIGGWYWTDDMFEDGFTLKASSSNFNKYDFGALVKQFKEMPVIFAPNNVLEDEFKITEGMIERMETKEMMKEIKIVEAKKVVHPKDEDHLKRVEKIQKKISYYKTESGFSLIEEVVPGRVVKVTYHRKEYKMKCDSRDTFSMEKALYLTLAKYYYGDTYTSEGIEQVANELKYKKDYVKKVEQAMKLFAAMEELEKENAEYEALLEARRQKRWERKQRQMDRRAEKKKAQEEKEREEKIQIQTEAYLRAMKAAKEEEKKEENVPVEEENTKAKSKLEENMTETTKESTKESTKNTEETATTTE